MRDCESPCRDAPLVPVWCHADATLVARHTDDNPSFTALIRKMVGKLGRKVVTVPKDGNCFYHSLSCVLQLPIAVLRRTAVLALAARLDDVARGGGTFRDLVGMFKPKGSDTDAYLRSAGRHGVWAREPEITALLSLMPFPVAMAHCGGSRSSDWIVSHEWSPAPHTRGWASGASLSKDPDTVLLCMSGDHFFATSLPSPVPQPPLPTEANLQCQLMDFFLRHAAVHGPHQVLHDRARLRVIVRDCARLRVSRDHGGDDGPAWLCVIVHVPVRFRLVVRDAPCDDPRAGGSVFGRVGHGDGAEHHHRHAAFHGIAAVAAP